MARHLANESTLLAEARVGNAEAFGTLVSQYYPNIYRLALQITGNREDAEDALQDAVLKAYSNLGQFRGNSRFYTWLVRIALNQALMKLRKRRSDKEVPLGDVGPTEGESPVPREIEDWEQNPERRYSEVEMEKILSRALDGLGPRLGTVFVLRNVQDFSAREIAEMRGLSVAAVKSRLIRARLRLRQRLSKFFKRAKFPHDGSPPRSSANGRIPSAPRPRRMDFQPRAASV